MPPSQQEVERAQQVLLEHGLEIRRSIVGEGAVKSTLEASDFQAPMQSFVTQSCWGSIWSRPYLSRRDRSLLNVAMLCALNRSTELAVHVRGAVANGCTEVEIRETILHASIYAGMPAGMEGTRVAEKTLGELREKGVEVKKGDEVDDVKDGKGGEGK